MHLNETTIHIHTNGQFRVINSPNLHIFELLEEARTPRGAPAKDWPQDPLAVRRQCKALHHHAAHCSKSVKCNYTFAGALQVFHVAV